MSANVHAEAPKTRNRRVAGAATLLAASGLLALAGCGGSSTSNSTATTSSTPPSAPAPSATPSSTSSSAPSASAQTVSLEANKEGQLEYNTKSLSAKAGAVTIAFTNASSLPHNVTVESASGETVGASETFAGGTKNVSVSLKPGTYKFFCSVPGHRQAGMEGTLTVK